MKTLILYGTESGTTAYVAEVIAEHLTKGGHQVDILDAGKAPKALSLDDYTLVLFGSPTYANGQLPATLAMYLSQFTPNLAKKKVAVFSLGDRTFSHFCASAEILEGWIGEQGGTLCHPSIKIDGYPYDVSEIIQWVDGVISKL